MALRMRGRRRIEERIRGAMRGVIASGSGSGSGGSAPGGGSSASIDSATSTDSIDSALVESGDGWAVGGGTGVMTGVAAAGADSSPARSIQPPTTRNAPTSNASPAINQIGVERFGRMTGVSPDVVIAGISWTAFRGPVAVGSGAVGEGGAAAGST